MIRLYLAAALLAATLPSFADSSACQERATAGDVSGALSACSAALERNPEDANAWAHRGYAHGRSGKHDQAMIDFDRALGIDPRLVYALEGRAQLHSASRNHAAALTDLTTALAVEPGNSRLLAMAAQLSHALGQKNETIAFMERATKADPQNPEWWLGLASLHADDPKKKERMLDKAVKASSSDYRALHVRGHFHEDSQKLGKAADDFRAASRISPNESHLYSDLARTLLAQNKHDAAMTTLDQGLAVKADARLLNQRSSLRLATGNPLGAADDLRAWRELGPSPQAERLQEPINAALYEQYAPGLQSAVGDTDTLQLKKLDCGVSQSASAWLSALTAAGGKVGTARENLANQETDDYVACLAAAQAPPTSRFAEVRQRITSANSGLTSASERLRTDCLAFPSLADQCRQLDEDIQQQAAGLLATLRQHEASASTRRLEIAERQRGARDTALAAIDKAATELGRSAKTLFAERIDTAMIAGALATAREHTAPNASRLCPSPSVRAPSTQSELEALNRNIDKHRNCLDEQFSTVRARMYEIDDAFDTLSEQRNLLDALGNYRCSSVRSSGCITDDAWTRASNLLPASAVTNAQNNRDAHRGLLEHGIPALAQHVNDQVNQINESVARENRAQAINDAAYTFTEALGQALEQNQRHGDYFPNSSTSRPGIR